MRPKTTVVDAAAPEAPSGYRSCDENSYSRHQGPSVRPLASRCSKFEGAHVPHILGLRHSPEREGAGRAAAGDQPVNLVAAARIRDWAYTWLFGQSGYRPLVHVFGRFDRRRVRRLDKGLADDVDDKLFRREDVLPRVLRPSGEREKDTLTIGGL